MKIDPWILSFSALTVLATVWMGFWSAKKSRTASDFFVAGRSVSVGWNASAISGEYLSAASFMGVAGMVMSSGYDALWYPVCYACGYLFLLLFIAGPLRRFGAYTIPDFAEGRFDSPLFRKIAVVFVLFIGFFYTMPQMKGAGTTLAYIFPGLPYWAGVVLVGAVITLNVALGGMKGITLVQAFQYWAKMFAISVPVFVLMTVYGHYGVQLARNPSLRNSPLPPGIEFKSKSASDEFGVSIVQAKHSQLVPTTWSWWQRFKFGLGEKFDRTETTLTVTNLNFRDTIGEYAGWTGTKVAYPTKLGDYPLDFNPTMEGRTRRQHVKLVEQRLAAHGLRVFQQPENILLIVPSNEVEGKIPSLLAAVGQSHRLPAKAPADATWLNPFGPLTTKPAKTAAAALTHRAALPLRADLSPDTHMTVNLSSPTLAHALDVYADLTGRQPLPRTNSVPQQLDELLNGQLARWNLVKPASAPDSGVRVHGDGVFTAGEVKAALETFFRTNGLALQAEGTHSFRVEPAADKEVQQAWLAKHERPLALLYTYSLIIALVCGTAGLPHILVRFYTNPDGVAAKRTTMWVMILIGVFYLFPPVFGVMGRNLMPSLYEGAGAKGTDKVVLELPRILNPGAGRDVPRRGEGSEGEGERSQPSQPSPTSPTLRDNPSSQTGFPWGSVLSGITCAGAFAAFMSTFSGLLVSMTGALAHDVYGRIFRPRSTPDQRLRMFKIFAVVVGAGAMLLGFLVESFEINKMVGWAFAIAATSYFPLLFLSTWWRGITMKGAATGMLVGGTLSLVAIGSTMFADQALWAAGIKNFYAVHPLLRILAEQPAIWALPLALGLMFVVSKLTAQQVPADIRMKMLVLHAPEALGLKQEYIQEHQHGH